MTWTTSYDALGLVPVDTATTCQILNTIVYYLVCHFLRNELNPRKFHCTKCEVFR